MLYLVVLMPEIFMDELMSFLLDLSHSVLFVYVIYMCIYIFLNRIIFVNTVSVIIL